MPLHGACSAISGTVAPRLRKYFATANSSGPVPATITRRSEIGQPPLTSACSPPAPITFGNVQPGKGRNSSRAPVARIRLLKDSSIGSPAEQASSVPGDGASSTCVCGRNSTRAASKRFSQGDVSPRQIWPPAAGLASTTPIEPPPSEAAHAAAIPAGPAPAIRISKRRLGTIRLHLHAGTARRFAALAMGRAIDRDPALETNTHAAERPARLTTNGLPESSHTRQRDGGRDGGARGHADGSAIDLQLDGCFRHAPAPSENATAGMARRRSREGAPESGP